MRINFPPYLQPGNTIGIVAPAGFMPFEKMQACIEALDNWGYQVRLGVTTHSESQNYFSAPDEERLRDLQQMLDDPGIHAILCARGGYGTSRIIDHLDFKKFLKNPKWIIGFSDITVLQAYLLAKHRMATLHAPMAAAFGEYGADSPYVLSLKHALEGKPAQYEAAPDAFNRQGDSKGHLVGGNLALLAHICGTSSDIRTRNRILFLEDTGEYLYQADRMLVQLKRSGKLSKLAGLVVGDFSDMKDTERPFGKTLREVVMDHVGEYGYPVCFDFPVGHRRENYAVKIGARYRLSVSTGSVVLQEL